MAKTPPETEPETKTPPETETERRNGKAIAEQPYSVDPEASPKVGRAGPKRSQKQTGQGLQDPEDGENDGE